MTNPAEVEKGEKPILEEVGPYTFEERRTYDIIGWDDKEEFLNLKFRKNYFYVGGKSLDDKVTVLNVPLVTLYKLISIKIPWVFQGLAYRLLDRKRYPILISHTVNDLLFHGYEDSLIHRICRDEKFLKWIGAPLKIPSSIDQNGRFSFMASVSVLGV